MSNTKNSAPERVQLVDALNTHKPVALGGKWRNNVYGPVADKIAFQSTYKFVLAVENYSAPGYLTEKFAQAAQSNAIPIYWGDPTITQYINPKSFINCHDFKSMEALVARIRELDQDDEAYRAMLSEPWFINREEPPEWRDATFANFLGNILTSPTKRLTAATAAAGESKLKNASARWLFNLTDNGGTSSVGAEETHEKDLRQGPCPLAIAPPQVALQDLLHTRIDGVYGDLIAEPIPNYNERKYQILHGKQPTNGKSVVISIL